ncbi:MAG TPA: hypothetical protein VGW78_04025 [Candidatus Babeliales bacterium]|jgi:hypothetical protein|nr:hypothetical protein [Candidatus Babeliales bacterium]
MSIKYIQHAAVAVSCLSFQMKAMDIEPEVPQDSVGRIPISVLVHPKNLPIFEVARQRPSTFNARTLEIKEQTRQKFEKETDLTYQVADEMMSVNEIRHSHRSNDANADRIEDQNNSVIDWRDDIIEEYKQERNSTIFASMLIDNVLQGKDRDFFQSHVTNKYKAANGNQIPTTFDELVKNMPQSIRVAKRKFASITSCMSTFKILKENAREALERDAKKPRIEKKQTEL